MNLTPNSVSIRNQIDKKSIECLNQDDNYPVSNIIETMDPFHYLQSSMDSQLLIQFQFIQPVRIECIVIGAAKKENGEYDINHCPSSIKIFINCDHLGFNEAESTIPTHEATLPIAEVESKGNASVSLSLAKFRSVKSIALFLDENQGYEEVSRIGYIDIIGRTVEATNMSHWKPIDKDQQWAANDS